MAVTLSHQSALEVVRTLRSEGVSMHEMETVALAEPSAWVGSRLGAKNFAPDVWRWRRPSPARPLHIVVPSERHRMRNRSVTAHVALQNLPARSVLWVDEHTRIVCPELLFIQMAAVLALPELVMVGMELCGHFTRCADNPLMGDVHDGIPTATSVERLTRYLDMVKGASGVASARVALRYICDHAASAPEAVLATMLGLPPAEGGYGLGPVRLNERVEVEAAGPLATARNRYPDLMLGLAPVGLNYDGSKHFDIDELMAAAEWFARSDATTRDAAREMLRGKLVAARAKVLDDNMRDRQLAAQGRIVFPVTKEDMSDGRHMDGLVRQMLECAHKVFGVDVGSHLGTLDDTMLTRDRWDVLESLAPRGGFWSSSYGKL